MLLVEQVTIRGRVMQVGPLHWSLHDLTIGSDGFLSEIGPMFLVEFGACPSQFPLMLAVLKLGVEFSFNSTLLGLLFTSFYL